jgi:transposase
MSTAAPHATLYTGLDLHKRSVFALTVDAAGQEVAREKLPARADSLALYFADLPGSRGAKHRAVAEATTGWYWVKDALVPLGVDFRLAHANGVKAITGAKVKTDAKDARKLAQLLRVNLLPEAHVISDELRPLRDVLRTRLRLVERRASAANSVSRLLEKMNVKDVADLPELMQLQARCHLEQAELLAAQVKELERALHPHLVPDADVQRLLRIPGIGKVNAFTLKLEIDDVARFPSDRAFFSYCRLVPGADNSADRTKHKRSREGNRYLKLAFSHATVRAIQHYPEVREWYRRKRRKKPEAIARALVAKEIARIVYHVLRKREDFNGTFKGVVLSRVKQEQWPLLPSPASRTDSGGMSDHRGTSDHP